MSLKLAHLINPVTVDSGSDLHLAQPITFAAMRAAQACARGQVEVDRLAASFPEDAPFGPAGVR